MTVIFVEMYSDIELSNKECITTLTGEKNEQNTIAVDNKQPNNLKIN